jgi:threonine/homoserine/homoserine lactone efflux protein
MLSWSSYSGFLVVTGLLAIAPGPDTFVMLRSTFVGGPLGGMLAGLGILVGNILQGCLVAFGLGLVIITVRPAFVALHWLGAAYLLYLGVQALLAARRGEYQPMGFATNDQFRHFRQGLLSNITNPKALVLYLSVLPQYLQPGLGVGATLLLACTLGVIGACWQLGLLFAAHRARTWLNNRRIRRVLDGILGTVLIAFGVGLAAE